MAEIRPATLGDMDQLLQMGRKLCEPSPLTFDPDIARKTISTILQYDIVVVEDIGDGILSGFVFGYVVADFCVEPCGYISKFYVEPELRGKGTSRALLQGFETEAIARGAKILYAASHTGAGARTEVLYVNLFKRFGYEVSGRTLARLV